MMTQPEPELFPTTCIPYCDGNECDWRCGFAATILQYFRAEGNYYPQNFPYGIPDLVVERIRRSVLEGKIPGDFSKTLGVVNEFD